MVTVEFIWLASYTTAIINFARAISGRNKKKIPFFFRGEHAASYNSRETGI